MAETYISDKFDDAKQDVSDFCDYAVVKVDRMWGIGLFITNILLPGVGTFISAFKDRKFNGLACLFGVL